MNFDVSGMLQIGQGTYSNVYKARDKDTGKIVALKKVRFETTDPESVKFMAREITILRQLDHPNVIKLEGLATSRMQYSLYLVFDYMQSDLARVISRPERLTEPQVETFLAVVEILIRMEVFSYLLSSTDFVGQVLYAPTALWSAALPRKGDSTPRHKGIKSVD